MLKTRALFFRDINNAYSEEVEVREAPVVGENPTFYHEGAPPW